MSSGRLIFIYPLTDGMRKVILRNHETTHAKSDGLSTAKAPRAYGEAREAQRPGTINIYTLVRRVCGGIYGTRCEIGQNKTISEGVIIMADPLEALRQIDELRYNMKFFGNYDMDELLSSISCNLEISRQKNLDKLEGIIERTLEMNKAAWKLHDILRELNRGK